MLDKWDKSYEVSVLKQVPSEDNFFLVFLLFDVDNCIFVFAVLFLYFFHGNQENPFVEVDQIRPYTLM